MNVAECDVIRRDRSHYIITGCMQSAQYELDLPSNKSESMVTSYDQAVTFINTSKSAVDADTGVDGWLNVEGVWDSPLEALLSAENTKDYTGNVVQMVGIIALSLCTISFSLTALFLKLRSHVHEGKKMVSNPCHW